MNKCWKHLQRVLFIKRSSQVSDGCFILGNIHERFFLKFSNSQRVTYPRNFSALWSGGHPKGREKFVRTEHTYEGNTVGTHFISSQVPDRRMGPNGGRKQRSTSVY